MTNPEETPSAGPVDRRRFCTRIGIGSLAVAAAGSAAVSVDFLTPGALYEPPSVFDAGKPEEFAPGSITLFPRQRVFLMCTDAGEFYALSAVCTHLGCIINYKTGEDEFACPCHGSHFTAAGEVQGGPAPRDLDRFQVTLNDQRRLVVDTSVIVTGHASILKVQP